MRVRNTGRRAGRVRGLGLVAAAVLTVTACGGAEETATGPEGDTTEEESPPAEDDSAPAEGGGDVDFSGETVEVWIRSSPGGGYDTWGRQVAAHIGDYLPGNPSVEVVNVPGAGGNVMLSQLYAAEPDGTTFGITNIVSVALQTVTESLDFDPLEMTSLPQVAEDQKGVFINPEGRFSSFEDILEAEEPVNVAVTGLSGGAGITAITLFESLDVPWQPVTHDGSSEAVLSTVRGDTDLNINDLASSAVADFVEQGELEPALYTGLEPHPEFPDVPPASEFGLERDFALTSPEARAFFGPPNMDPEVVATIEQAMREAVEDPGFQEWLESSGSTLEFVGADEARQSLEDTADALAVFSDTFLEFLG